MIDSMKFLKLSKGYTINLHQISHLIDRGRSMEITMCAGLAITTEDEKDMTAIRHTIDQVKDGPLVPE